MYDEKKHFVISCVKIFLEKSLFADHYPLIKGLRKLLRAKLFYF